MSYCVNCGTKAEAGHKFCTICGKPVPESSAPVKPVDTPTKVAIQPKTQEKPKPKGSKTSKNKRIAIPKLTVKQGIGFVAVLGVMSTLIALVIGFNRPLEASEIPSYNEAFESSKRSQTAKTLCPSLELLLTDKFDVATQEKRIYQLSQIKAPRKMARFYNRVTWLSDSDLLTEFKNSVEDLLENKLAVMVESFELRGIDDTNRELLPNLWKSDFRNSVFSVCVFTENYETEVAQLAKYDNALNKAVGVAKSAPWYPKGYYVNEFLNPNVAFKWVDRVSDCYSCYQWDMKVVTKTGCYSGLYIEGNILSGETVVDWSNDRLNYLASNQTGNMRFQSYVDGYGTLSFRVTEINCY